MKNKNVKYPCRGCVYFDACGDNTRTMPCDGRMTKTEKKKQEKGNFIVEIARKLDNGEFAEVMTVDGIYTNSEDFLEAQKEK